LSAALLLASSSAADGAMESIIMKFINQKLGDFLQVDAKNVQLSPGSGQLSLKEAAVRADVFDGLHLPFAVRGGFLEDVTVNVSSGLFARGSGSKVVVKNVFLVLGPHETDWSVQHVYDCKSKLVDLVMKVYELKGALKKKSSSDQGRAGGYFASMKQRMSENIAKHFLGMLEVHISNIHVRYEDAITQSLPFACGFKLGFVGVTSDDKPQRSFFFGFEGADDKQRDGPRATGDWKYADHSLSDPLFRQSIVTRRVSAYWDIGTQLFATQPLSGEQVRANFCRLNLRETFSTCVVDKLLENFPPDHPRRQRLPGPNFRERLDFHQYVLFPVSIHAHIVANRNSEACVAQKAPLKDADVMIERLEVAIDTGQMRSVNELIAFAKEFKRQDSLSRTRPFEPISNYMDTMSLGACKSSSSTSQPDVGSSGVVGEPVGDMGNSVLAQQRKAVVRAWWHHALEGVRIITNLPRATTLVNAADLRERSQLRETYVNLCLQAKASEVKGVPAKDLPPDHPLRLLQQMQLRLNLPEILEWRLQALTTTADAVGARTATETSTATSAGGAAPAPAAPKEGEQQGRTPSTLQVRLRLNTFDVYFLAAAGRFWIEALGVDRKLVRASQSDDASGRRRRRVVIRQVLVKGNVANVQLEAVQKGFISRRVARWVELRVGGVGAENCCVKETSAARQLVSLSPIENLEGATVPVCVFVGLTMLEAKDGAMLPGDIPLSAVLDPVAGLRGHLKAPRKEASAAQLKRLGFLQQYKDEPGRLLTCVHARVGLINAVDVAPLRRRLISLLKSGSGPAALASEMLRRPSLAALDRELLHRVQKKVELMVGKSNMLSVVEGVLDGVEAKAVDHYNSRNALCKHASLGAVQWKALMSGCPQQMQVQIKRYDRGDTPQPPANLLSSLAAATSGLDATGLLPWKVAMSLVDGSDFELGAEAEAPTVLETTAAVSDPRARPSQLLRVDGRGTSAMSRLVGRGKKGKKATPQAKASAVAASVRGPVALVVEEMEALPGAWFRKWSRKGQPRWRFVVFDEIMEAIVWKTKASDRGICGLIPLMKVQDICVGAKTPNLRRISHSQFDQNLAWSVVASDRTLDLQAESMAVQHKWVAWMRERFKMYFLQHNGETGMRIQRSLLPNIKSKSKTYPAKLLPAQGDLCALLTTCRKLRPVSSLGTKLCGTGQHARADLGDAVADSGDAADETERPKGLSL